MKSKRVYAILNDATKETLGETALVQEDLLQYVKEDPAIKKEHLLS